MRRANDPLDAFCAFLVALLVLRVVVDVKVGALAFWWFVRNISDNLGGRTLWLRNGAVSNRFR
jgi:hypothetical protein